MSASCESLAIPLYMIIRNKEVVGISRNIKNSAVVCDTTERRVLLPDPLKVYRGSRFLLLAVVPWRFNGCCLFPTANRVYFSAKLGLAFLHRCRCERTYNGLFERLDPDRFI